MEKILFAFGLILVGLASGYLIQVLVRKEILQLPIPLDRLRRGLQKAALLWINPLPIVGAIWIMKIHDPRMAVFPLLGTEAIFIGGLLAFGGSRLLKLGRREAGAFFGCGFFTNTAAFGAFISYVFLGESGFALVPIYRLFEEFAFYVIGFPVARWYGTESPEREAISARLKRVGTDAFTIVPAIGLLVGFFLNRSGLPRPAFYEMVNAVCIPLAIFLLLTSIGLAMRFTTIRYYLKECLAVSAIKFMLVPAALTLTASLLGFGRIQEGLPLKVVLIVSSMPVAFTALVPPSIYDLDLDLANACWLFTTALLGIMVPALFLVINLM